MKRILFATLIVVLSCVQISIGQKAEKLYFEGYFKNQPKFYLPEAPYTVKYAVSEWFKEKISEKEVALELKGFPEGKGYSVLFLSDDPEFEISAQSNNKANAAERAYKAVVELTANNRIKFLDSNGQLIYNLKIQPKLFQSREVSMEESKTQEGALKIANGIVNRKGDYMKGMYVKEIINAYQDTLDLYFGNYIRKEKINLFTIKPKKFNYVDFNNATEKIKSACLTEAINKDEILSAISVLEGLRKEYKVGKKTRFSDINIDHLHLNLAQAYLLAGKYVEAQKYLEESIEHKGNRSIEANIASIIKPQTINAIYFEISKSKYEAVMAKKSKILRQNNSLFFNLFLSGYLSKFNDDIYSTIEFFPMNLINVNKLDSEFKTDFYVEKRIIDYNEKGDPINIDFKIYEEGKLYRSRYFTFKYIDGKISEAILNGRTKFKISYKNDQISEVFYKHNQSSSSIFKVNYSESGKNFIDVTEIENGEENVIKGKDYVIFNDVGDIEEYKMGYRSSENVYDQDQNWIGLAGTKSSGERVIDKCEVEYDKNGAAIKLVYDEDFVWVKNIIYSE